MHEAKTHFALSTVPQKQEPLFHLKFKPFRVLEKNISKHNTVCQQMKLLQELGKLLMNSKSELNLS